MNEWKSLCPVFCGLLLTITAVVSSGCAKQEKYGAEGVVLRGRIVRGGEPLPLDRPDVGLGVVDLQLIPKGQQEPIDFSGARADGKFEFLGTGQGVPAGEYKLAVFHNKTGTGTDELTGRIDASNSSITIHVPADHTGDALDLGDIELKDHLR